MDYTNCTVFCLLIRTMHLCARTHKHQRRRKSVKPGKIIKVLGVSDEACYRSSHVLIWGNKCVYNQAKFQKLTGCYCRGGTGSPFQSLLARGSLLTHCKSMGKDYLKAKMLWYNGPPRLSHTRDQTSTATARRIQQTPANIKATHRFEVVHKLALLC